jgi:peptide chain release factor 1
MTPSIQTKLENLVERHTEIAQLLAEPEVIEDQSRYRKLSVEYAQLEALAEKFAAYRAAHPEQ